MTRKMKDSRIEWIGEIPEEWERRKLKVLGRVKGRIGFKGYTTNDIVDEEMSGRAIVLGGTNIMREGYISYEKLTYLSEEKYLESPEIMLYGGEILITKVGAGTGENAIYKNIGERVTINPNVMIYIPNNKENSFFINYYLLSDAIKKDIYLESNKSGAQPAINQEYVKNISIMYPPQKEQTKIVKYLDNKCAKIDKTIEGQKQVIETLKEYKKSVITESVTKGLNPNIRMKDSGIEWIGEIPEHWKITKLKNVIVGIKDGTHGTFERIEQGFPLLSAKNVFENGIKIDKNESMISKEDYLLITSNGFPKKDDILLCCVGTIGRCCLYTFDEPIAFQRSVAFIRCNDLVYNRYLLYLLKSKIVEIQTQQLTNASAQSGLYMGAIKEIKLIIADKDEQKQIADYLDKRCLLIDSSIAKKQKLIEKLTEYKKSLIYECVTGKREV